VLQDFPELPAAMSAIAGQCFREFAAHIPSGINLVGCR